MTEAIGKKEKVLLSCLVLEEQGMSPLNSSCIVVEAWKQFPHDFGLTPYQEVHPDSHKILFHMMGRKGLVSQNFLSRVSAKNYLLTVKGRRRGYQLADALNWSMAKNRKIIMEVVTTNNNLWQSFVGKATESRAYNHYHSGLGSEITIKDAYDFWGATMKEANPTPAREQFLQQLRLLLSQVTQKDMKLSSGQIVTMGSYENILAVDSFLEKRFHHLLKVLQRRHA